MKTKNKIYMIIIFFGLMTLFLFIFFVFPSFKKIKSNSDDLSLRKRNIAILKNQADEAESFKKNYEDYAPNFKKIDQLFVDFKDPIGFIEFLEKTAADSEIKLEIFLSPHSLKEEEPSIAFQFFSSGDFLKILEFTKALESGPYLIEIKNLTIKNLESKNVSAVFLIKTFVQLQ